MIKLNSSKFLKVSTKKENSQKQHRHRRNQYLKRHLLRRIHDKEHRGIHHRRRQRICVRKAAESSCGSKSGKTGENKVKKTKSIQRMKKFKNRTRWHTTFRGNLQSWRKISYTFRHTHT